LRDARNHYPRIKHHTPHHQRRGDNNPPPPGAQPLPVPHTTGQRSGGLVVSKPNSVFSGQFLPGRPKEPAPEPRETFVVHQNRRPLQGRPIQRIAQLTESPTGVGGA